MHHCEPKLVYIESFSVQGLNVRTINRDEFNPKTARIAPMWNEFFTTGVADKVMHRVPNTPIYGVYSHYDADDSSYFNVTAGVEVSREIVEPKLPTVQVVSGSYLLFTHQGDMPAAVVQTWEYIWSYFKKNTLFKRNYCTDFEAYLGPKDIAVYIGVTS